MVPPPSLGGFPIRFPHPYEPGDTGWHVEGSYLPNGEEDYWVNLRSRDRALIMRQARCPQPATGPGRRGDRRRLPVPPVPGPRRPATSRQQPAVHGPATAPSHRAAGPRPPRRRLQPGRAGRPPRAQSRAPEHLRMPPVPRTQRRQLLATPLEIPSSRASRGRARQCHAVNRSCRSGE